MFADDYDKLLIEQIDYYKSRAGEYDEWFLRQGRYDHGQELNRLWFDEVEVLHQALYTFRPKGEVLELACGTGIWTEYLLDYADQITAVDAASEVLELNRRRTQNPKVRYVQADLFDWQPDKKYDVVFFSFWLSHVLPKRFESFWKLVNQACRPRGRVFFIDSRHDVSSTAKDHQLQGKQSTIATRRLNDGRQFNIVKVFYDTQDLSKRLRKLGWSFTIRTTRNYFLYGFGSKSIF